MVFHLIIIYRANPLFFFPFSLSPIRTSPPSQSTPPCPSDILRCHAKQKTATASRISCPDTPKHHTPSSRSHSKPSALVHKYEVIRKSTSKHNTTHSTTSLATSHLPKITFNKFIMKIQKNTLNIDIGKTHTKHRIRFTRCRGSLRNRKV